MGYKIKIGVIITIKKNSLSAISAILVKNINKKEMKKIISIR
jgi:hypothetical protein